MSFVHNHKFYYLEKKGNDYFNNRKKPFIFDIVLSKEDIRVCVEFAYDMLGKHRETRSGGLIKRTDKKILFDAIRGKFGEFGFYNYYSNQGLSITLPDVSILDRGKWDSGDFIIADKQISVKSTKHFGNLLLLEEKDWDSNGRYIPDNSTYDFIYLTKVQSNFEDIYKSVNGSKEEILKNIDSLTIKVNIAGYITFEDLVNVIIKNKYIIPQKAMLNGKVEMDANNYYVQAGDLRVIK